MRVRRLSSAILGSLLAVTLGVGSALAATPGGPPPQTSPGVEVTAAANPAVDLLAPADGATVSVTAPAPAANATATAAVEAPAQPAEPPHVATATVDPAGAPPDTHPALDCPAPGGPTHTISGHVYAPDGSPLSGVLVETWPWVCGWSNLTGPDGAYSFALTEGQYQVYFNVENQAYLYGCYSATSGTGFTPYCDTSTIVNLASDVTIDAHMDAGHLITGTVTGLGGAPLSGIAVLATSDGYQRQVGSGTDGSYAVRVAAGNYTVRFADTAASPAYTMGYYSASGFVTDSTAATPVSVTTADVPDISVQMSRNYLVSGSLLGVGDVALGGGQLHAYSSTFSIWWPIGSDGTFAVPVPSGSYTIEYTVVATGYWTGFYADPGMTGYAGFTPNSWAASSVDVGTSDVSLVATHVPPVVRISGTVRTATGAPISDISTYASAGSIGWGASGYTGSDGYYSIAVIPGTYIVQFSDWTNTYAAGYYGAAAGYQLSYTAAAPVDATSGDATDISVAMPVNHHIRGTVRAPSGTTIAGVRVEASTGGSVVAMAFGADDGTYDVAVPTGSYKIEIYDVTSTFLSGWLGASGYVSFESQAVPVVVGSGDSTGNDATLPYFVTSLEVTGAASPIATGTSTTFTVRAINFGGGTASAWSGTIHFTSSDPQAILPADYTFSWTDGGTYTFSVTFRTPGTQSIRASSTLAAAITGAQEGIVVVAPTNASRFVVTSATSWVAGASHTMYVTPVDASGKRVPDYVGTVHFTSTDPAAVLPADYTFTLSDRGVHSFVVGLRTAGTRTITATDTVAASITGTQAGIVVTPGALKRLSVTTTTSWVAGAGHTVYVFARDNYGNTVTTYAGTVHLSSSDAAAVLPADYAFTSTDRGVHAFVVTLRTAGTQSVTARDVAVSTVTGSQAGIVVTGGSAKTLIVTTTRNWVAGAAHSVTVTARDAYGNTATGYTGTVHFTSSDPKATLPTDYTFAAGDAGTHVFSLGATLRTAGTAWIRATDTVRTTVTGAMTGIPVTPAAASTFVVTSTKTWTAGSAHSITVTATDAYGNTVIGYTGTVHFTSSDPLATLPADYTFTAGDAGTHVFTTAAVLRTHGTQWIRATDTARPSVTGSVTGIAVS